MSLKKTLAGVAPFAHLLSRAGAARAESEDDERKQRENESDDEYAKRMEELDEKERAEQEEREREEARARGEGNDIDGDDTEAEDGDDETDDAKRAARAAERARCARIIARGIANGNVEQAAVFAFNTKMSSATAAQALGAAKAVAPKAAPVARRPSLDERMAHVRTPNPGNETHAATPTLAEQIIAAGKMRRGEK
ncbi:hypothetical protein [Burkholderia sp. LMG 13014]|uniref:hypothetical protein n=1 Tax=Burkholderia sp. LMG 13014 TaxID=2709306 RepID=UPI001964A024|nr:hypothetical protein [Burkholderia sp. LMG 13014]